MVKIVSKALIKNKSGKYLLLYRGDTHPNFPGHLDLPGGEVESEETSKTATAREVQEETGICIYPNGLKKLFIKQHKNTKHVLFEIVIDKTEADIPIKLSWEHKKYHWMTLSELLDANIPEGADSYYIDVIFPILYTDFARSFFIKINLPNILTAPIASLMISS